MAKKTNTGLPTHCSFVVDRHGKRRVRFRKNGFSAYLHEKPGTPAFSEEYFSALHGESHVRANIGRSQTRPGSFNALIVSYYRSPEFRSLSDSTKATYRGIIERFRLNHGDRLAIDLRRHHLRAIIGAMDDRPAAANNLLRMVNMLLNHAADTGMIQTNPIQGMRGFKRNSTGFHSWSEDEIESYLRRHGAGTRARMAFLLLLHTGQRRGDVINMGWQHIQDGWIRVEQQKTGERLEIPVHPELAAELARAPKDRLCFVLNGQGYPFTPAGFGNWFRDQCNEAGLKHCSAHGLRKAAARRLAEAGCSALQIGSITGHRTLKEVSRYTAAADQKRLAEAAQKILIQDSKLVGQ